MRSQSAGTAHSSASKPCSVVAQLAQFFTTDAQRFSVYQGRPRPAADDVAACTSASAARSTSQLAGWPALLPASLQAVPRQVVVQATYAMRVADLGLARRR